MKFLIVDDSLAMQTIIKINLDRAGYKGHDFKTAIDGIKALNMIEEWHPDVVITDWHMPNMTGIELLNEVQKRGHSVNIGLLTSETNPELIEEAKSAGALFVLHKPFDIDELKEAMQLVVDVKSSPTKAKVVVHSSHTSNVKSSKSLQLPSVPALNKLVQGLYSDDITLEKSDDFYINPDYLPYAVVLFCLQGQAAMKAMCVMDVRTAAIIASALEPNAKAYSDKILKDKTLSDDELVRVQKMMGTVSVLFDDPKSTAPLEVKGIHMIAKPSDQLVKLCSTSKEKRLVLTMKSKQVGEGLLMFLEIAEK